MFSRERDERVGRSMECSDIEWMGKVKCLVGDAYTDQTVVEGVGQRLRSGRRSTGTVDSRTMIIHSLDA